MIQDMEVFLSALSFAEKDLEGKIAVIIDVLRASSTMVTALQHGADGIIPTLDKQDALSTAETLKGREYLLCGEEDGEKIEGFDLGNSPAEYTREVVQHKTLVFCTTNGTRAIRRSGMASTIYVASFLNMKSIINHLKRVDSPVVLVCAGWRGRSSLEDLLCAGNIIYELMDDRLPDDAPDGAKIALGVYEKFGDNLEESIRSSSHARRLKDIVHESDISYCCQTDKMNILPKLEDGIILDVHG